MYYVWARGSKKALTSTPQTAAAYSSVAAAFRTFHLAEGARTSIRELAAPNAVRPNPGILLQVAGCAEAFQLCEAHASLPSLSDLPPLGCSYLV